MVRNGFSFELIKTFYWKKYCKVWRLLDDGDLEEYENQMLFQIGHSLSPSFTEIEGHLRVWVVVFYSDIPFSLPEASSGSRNK